MALNLENFEQVKQKGEEFYRTLTDVYCPYFKDKVHFNAQGLEHLKFKRHAKARSQQDQYMRFKLLHLAPAVLRASGTLQGCLEAKTFERVRVHSRTDTVLKEVEYSEFVAVLENVRVKIIVKRIGQGPRYFWSLIPHWGRDRLTQRRKLHAGTPEED
jgi:hypothetical protein